MFFSQIKDCKIPFKNEKFDLIFSSFVLQHIMDNSLVKHYAEQFSELLDDDGHLLFIENTNDYTDNHHMYCRSLEDLNKIFNDFKLEIIGSYHTENITPHSIIIGKKNTLKSYKEAIHSTQNKNLKPVTNTGINQRILIVEPYGHITPGHLVFETFNILKSFEEAIPDSPIDVLTHHGFAGNFSIETRFSNVRFFQSNKNVSSNEVCNQKDMNTREYMQDLSISYLDCIKDAESLNNENPYDIVIVLDGFTRSIDLGRHHLEKIAKLGTKVFLKIVNFTPLLLPVTPQEMKNSIITKQKKDFSDIMKVPNVYFFFLFERYKETMYQCRITC
jgi:hypothetical protein